MPVHSVDTYTNKLHTAMKEIISILNASGEDFTRKERALYGVVIPLAMIIVGLIAPIIFS